MAAYLVDTNVLVHAYDPSASAKQQRAVAVLSRLTSTRQGCISAQVLGEFFVTATRKIPNPLTASDAERRVTNLSRIWRVYDVTGIAVLEAIRGTQRYQLSYWDSLIWAVAKLNGVPNVLTEDLPSSPLIEGVRFINPFAAEFAASSLG